MNGSLKFLYLKMRWKIPWFVWLGLLFTGSNAEILGCSVISCGSPPMPLRLRCSDETFILIRNVTSQTDLTVDEHAFQTLGRMCMGKSECSPSNFCQERMTKNDIKITYFCIEDTSIEKQCNQLSEIFHLKGFIQSPDYPVPTSRGTCQWRISVPKKFYVHIRLHEVEIARSTNQCEGGLHLRTAIPCDNHDFDSSLICGKVRQYRDFIGCGDVTIELSHVNDAPSFRFWLSFQVKEMGLPVILPLDLVAKCPYGTGEEVFIPKQVGPPLVISGTHMTKTTQIPTAKINFNSTHETKAPSPMDTTEKTVLYVAVAVAAGSLTSLVIVLVVCIRRQRKQKSVRQQTHHYNERPLPLIEKTLPLALQLSNTEVSKATLHVGYSRVADELPYRSLSTTKTASPAYAEVDQEAGMPQAILVKYQQVPNNKIPQNKPEHVYSEPKENTSKKIYEEITNGCEPCPCSELGDQVKLIQSQGLTRQRSIDVVKWPSTGKTGPYATCDLLAQYVPYENMGERTISRSESDDSFEMTENEMYEPFKSVHV